MAAVILYVLDEDCDVRRALHARLKPAITVWPFAHVDDFRDQIGSLTAAPIIADLEMTATNGSAVLSLLDAWGIHWPAIMTSKSADVPMTVDAMRKGALEVLKKPVEPELFDAALKRAYAQLAASAEHSIRCQAARKRIALLTARERSVVCELIAGKTNKAIADALTISPRTVEGHRAHALRKLDVRSIVEMVYLAADGGLDLRARDTMRA